MSECNSINLIYSGVWAGHAHSLLHVLLRLEHVDLPLPLQLVLILGPVPLVLRLGVERLARLLGLLLDVGAAHLLGVGVHLGPLGGCLVLCVRACMSALVGVIDISLEQKRYGRLSCQGSGKQSRESWRCEKN